LRYHRPRRGPRRRLLRPRRRCLAPAGRLAAAPRRPPGRGPAGAAARARPGLEAGARERAAAGAGRAAQPGGAGATPVPDRGRAVGVGAARGDEFRARRAVLADVGAPALYLRLLRPRHVPGWVRASIRRFRYGWGTFKVDWALAGPVPWSAAEARASAVVHAGDSLADLIAFTRQVRAGLLPANPYLVVGPQRLVDPGRAPAGGHPLVASSR